MEALSRKTEKEKVAELEAMLADATLSGDVTDDSSISFASEAPTPIKRHHHAPPSTRQDLKTKVPPTWRPAEQWSRSIDVGNNESHHMNLNRSFPAGGREEDVTARIYSSSSGTDSSASEQAEHRRRHQQGTNRARRHSGHGRMGAIAGHNKDSGRNEQKRRAEQDEAARLLRSQLAAARSQLEQKEIVTRSLQRQLDQRGEIEEQTQARAEEKLVAALAKASGLKEELARTSELLVEGALERQNLEQRCSTLAKDLRKSVQRTDDLEGQVSESRAELVRVTGALHARRGTDVVDAEMAFGEELQRVQESATREARALRQETSELRASLEQTKDKFRKACGERDSWRDEAELHASEVESLRETVSALRQYSENDTIDQLLCQISRWKRRAEELEQSQRVSSSPEGPSCFGSVSDVESSPSAGGSVEHSFPVAGQTEKGTRLRAANPATMPLMKQREEGQERLLSGRLQDANNALRQELFEAKEKLVLSERLQDANNGLQREVLEAKEKLLVLREEVAAATLSAREHASKRVTAEVRVKTLEGEAEANARAARESLAARRATKAKNFAEIKMAIQEDMGAELKRLRCVFQEQKQDKKSLGPEEAPLCSRCSNGSCAPQPLRADMACQAGSATVATARAKEERNVDDAQPLCLCGAPLTCGSDDCANSTNKESSLATAPASILVEEEVKRRMACVLAATAVAEGGVAAWAGAFSSARRLIHETLISLCKYTTNLLGAEGDSKPGAKVGSEHTLMGMLSKRLESAGDGNNPGGQESSAVVPWVPGNSKTEASAALEVLRDGVESVTDGIRLALADHAARVVPSAAAAAAVSRVIQHASTASQTEKEREAVEERGEGGGVDFGRDMYCSAQQRSVGVQVSAPGEPAERSAEIAVGFGRELCCTAQHSIVGVPLSEQSELSDRGAEGAVGQRHTVGVPVSQHNGLDERSAERGGDAGGVDAAGPAEAAPAWEGGRSGRSSIGRERDHDRERRRRSADGALVDKLRQEVDVLNDALQRMEFEKEDQKRLLTLRFEHQQAVELERQHAGHELGLREMHEYIMAMEQDFFGGGRAA